MNKRKTKCIICLCHIIGAVSGILSAITLYCILKQGSKKECFKRSVKKAFKTFENKIDI